MTRQNIDQEIEALARLDLNALRAVWAQQFGPPPALRSPDLLRLMLAWCIQARACGGLDAETRRALARTGPVKVEGLDLGVGARLTRTWKGRKVEVVVEDEAFCWEGRRYPSLSAVATAIAGTHWNGPRFFGVREPRP